MYLKALGAFIIDICVLGLLERPFLYLILGIYCTASFMYPRARTLFFLAFLLIAEATVIGRSPVVALLVAAGIYGSAYIMHSLFTLHPLFVYILYSSAYILLHVLVFKGMIPQVYSNESWTFSALCVNLVLLSVYVKWLP